MANNTIQIKRTSVSGRTANSTTLPNPGELALNMTDGIMYSTNGSVVFEIGANNTNQRVSGTLTVNAISANGGVGTAGQVLSSNGSSAYWATSSTLNAQQTVYTYTLVANTTVITGADDQTTTLSYVAGLENVFINGVRQISGVDYNTTTANTITLTSNAIAGEVVQVVAWTGSINSTNVNAQFAWTNTHSFSNTVSLAAISANGSLGTAGHVLHSNGTATYWAADDNAGGTVTSIATSNGISGGTITSTGTIGVTTGSTLTVNTTGIHVNSALSLTDLTVSGNLTVSGTRTYVNTTTLDVGDNIITLNADLGASAPSQNAGIEIMRGTSANVQFIWDETNDRWSTNSQPLAISSLVAAGAASGITTLAAGNTTITGFANVSGSITAGGAIDGNGSVRATGSGAILTISQRSIGTGDAWGIYSQSGEFNIYNYGASLSRLTLSSTGGVTSPDLAEAVGYKGLPQNQQVSAYTLALADQGDHIYATAGAFAITIPANATTAFPIGTAITIIVEDAAKTVVPAAGVTLVLAGTGAATTGTRTMAIGSVATLLKVQTNRWYISGAGVT